MMDETAILIARAVDEVAGYLLAWPELVNEFERNLGSTRTPAPGEHLMPTALFHEEVPGARVSPEGTPVANVEAEIAWLIKKKLADPDGVEPLDGTELARADGTELDGTEFVIPPAAMKCFVLASYQRAHKLWTLRKAYERKKQTKRRKEVAEALVGENSAKDLSANVSLKGLPAGSGPGNSDGAWLEYVREGLRKLKPKIAVESKSLGNALRRYYKARELREKVARRALHEARDRE